uniref:Uncharacterized protein n=1 Tax=Panagrolaimus sp. ES5 TaxID=591445 RepID=A0AC34GP56_9BILA
MILKTLFQNTPNGIDDFVQLIKDFEFEPDTTSSDLRSNHDINLSFFAGNMFGLANNSLTFTSRSTDIESFLSSFSSTSSSIASSSSSNTLVNESTPCNTLSAKVVENSFFLNRSVAADIFGLVQEQQMQLEIQNSTVRLLKNNIVVAIKDDGTFLNVQLTKEDLLYYNQRWLKDLEAFIYSVGGLLHKFS